jgi:hypothetical protein
MSCIGLYHLDLRGTLEHGVLLRAGRGLAIMCLELPSDRSSPASWTATKTQSDYVDLPSLRLRPASFVCFWSR